MKLILIIDTCNTDYVTAGLLFENFSWGGQSTKFQNLGGLPHFHVHHRVVLDTSVMMNFPGGAREGGVGANSPSCP